MSAKEDTDVVIDVVYIQPKKNNNTKEDRLDDKMKKLTLNLQKLKEYIENITKTRKGQAFTMVTSTIAGIILYFGVHFSGKNNNTNIC